MAVSKAAPLSAAFFASHQPYPRQPAMPATTTTAAATNRFAVALPQLLELLAADFLVNFVEDVGHEPIPAAISRPKPQSQAVAD